MNGQYWLHAKKKKKKERKKKEKKALLCVCVGGGVGVGEGLRYCHAGTQISIKPRECSTGKSQGPRKLNLVRLSSQLRAIRICCHATRDMFLLPG
jgi:hypothetical protein